MSIELIKSNTSYTANKNELKYSHMDAFNKLEFIGCWNRTINKSAVDRMNKQHITVFLISNIVGRAFRGIIERETI